MSKTGSPPAGLGVADTLDPASLAVRLVRAVFTGAGPALNRTLAGAAQLAALYSAALAMGLVL